MLDLGVGFPGLANCFECGLSFAIQGRHPEVDGSCIVCVENMIASRLLAGDDLELMLECEDCGKIILNESAPKCFMHGWICKKCWRLRKRQGRIRDFRDGRTPVEHAINAVLFRYMGGCRR